METIGGLKPKYNFKAPFDRYQPVVVRNIMSDLFRWDLQCISCCRCVIFIHYFSCFVNHLPSFLSPYLCRQTCQHHVPPISRVSSDPLYLPLRRPCVPFVKPPPVPVTTPQGTFFCFSAPNFPMFTVVQVPSGGTPVSTPRSATPKGAAGMQAVR